MTTPGSIPAGSDRLASWCVLSNPDKSQSLLKDGRIVHTHAAGTLAVAPSGKRFAVGELGGIRFVDARRFVAS